MFNVGLTILWKEPDLALTTYHLSSKLSRILACNTQIIYTLKALSDYYKSL